MRKVIKLLLPVIAMGALAFNSAQAELTVVTVSMQKLLEGYYKSAEATQRLESINQTAETELQEKQSGIRELADQAQAIQEELQNPMLSEESKSQKQKELTDRVAQIRQKESELQQWYQQTRNNLNQRAQEIQRTLIEEISAVVKEVALKDRSADIVLDSSGGSFPTVLHASKDLDITEKVLQALNADAPNN